MPSEKKNQEKPAVDVNAMIDQLVANAQKALEEYMKLDQEQVDKIVHAMALAGLDNHMPLAKLAYEETGRGVMEDKIIKNMFATEYIWHDIKKEKTVGVAGRERDGGLCGGGRACRRCRRRHPRHQSDLHHACSNA